MADPGERWVQRLRDGTPPPRGPLAIALIAGTVVGLVLAVLEFTHPNGIAALGDSRTFFLVLLVPIALVVAGPSIAIGAWVRGRQDRRVLALVRSGVRPALFLPVSTYAIRNDDVLPGRRPTLWTVDAAGLHAWVPAAASPVQELLWRRIRGIDVATEWKQGIRRTYGIWIDLDDGHVVLRPRAALERPFGTTPGQTEALMRVLRSVRHDVERSADPH